MRLVVKINSKIGPHMVALERQINIFSGQPL